MFDITELDDEGEFSLEGNGVLMIKRVAAGCDGNCSEEPAVSDCDGGGLEDFGHEPAFEGGVPVFRMDGTDDDGEWTVEPSLEKQEATESESGIEVDVIIDSGADISVAPLRLASVGQTARATGVLMQDAQGRRIREHGSRIIDITVSTLEGADIVIREKFAIAKIEAVILSLGRLLRWGWTLGCHDGKPTMDQGDHRRSGSGATPS